MDKWIKSVRWLMPAFLVISLAGCDSDGSDGKEGASGSPGPIGAPGNVGDQGPPAVDPRDTLIEELVVEQVSAVPDGSQVVVIFNLSNQNGLPVSGIQKIKGYSASYMENTESNNGAASTQATGASGFYWVSTGESTCDLTVSDGCSDQTFAEVAEGQYQYTYASSADPALPYRIGLQFYDGKTSAGLAMMKGFSTVNYDVDFPNPVATSQCSSCHQPTVANAKHGGNYNAGDMTVETCVLCHNGIPKSEGGRANNTYAMIGHGKHAGSDHFPGEIGRCSSCHIEEFQLTASVNGCLTCHEDDEEWNQIGAHAGAIEANNCRTCHTPDWIAESHEAPAKRDAMRANFIFDVISAEHNDSGEVEVVVKATDSSGETIDLAGLDTAIYQPRAWASALHTGESWLPGRNQTNVSRSAGNLPDVDNGDGTFTYLIANVPDNGDPIFAGVEGRIIDEKLGRFAIESTATDVRRVSTDGSKCMACHTQGFNQHGANRGGSQAGSKTCMACHGAFNVSSGRDNGVAVAMGPLAHSTHFGSIANEEGIAMPSEPNQCLTCHIHLDLTNVAPALVLVKDTLGTVTATSPIAANCMACHSNPAVAAHARQNGAEIGIEVTPVGQRTGDGGQLYDVYDPPAFTEACSVCHSESALFEAHGIE